MTESGALWADEGTSRVPLANRQTPGSATPATTDPNHRGRRPRLQLAYNLNLVPTPGDGITHWPVNTSPTQPSYDDDSIDLRELWQRLLRGLPLALGLGALGLVVAALLYLVASPFATTETSTRVVFGFSGY